MQRTASRSRAPLTPALPNIGNHAQWVMAVHATLVRAGGHGFCKHPPSWGPFPRHLTPNQATHQCCVGCGSQWGRPAH